MQKIKLFLKKAKRILSKIVKDRQLLGIFILSITVIIASLLLIGFLRTMFIISVLVILGVITKIVIDKKYKNYPNIESSDEEDMAKRKKSKKNKILSTALNVFLIFVLVCILLGFVFIVYIAVSAPNFNPSNLYRKESSIVYDANGDVVAKLGSEIRDTITYDDMPQVLIDAVIATEDSRFYQHNGVDFARFLKASVGQLLGNSSAGGGSTISMQVVKNSFTNTVATGIKGIIRKFTDVYMAMFKLEKNYTKEQILEYYVNIPFLGSNSYGVAEAAETYFGKDVSELNLSESALIAGIFQAPTAYDPYVHPDKAAERRAVVLRLMRRHGYITKEQEDMANAISIESLLSTKEYTNPYQSFIDVVLDEIYEKTGENPYNTSMKIYTTLDKNKQDHLNDVITGKTYTWTNDVVQTGVAVTDVQTGAILAISGGRNVTAARAFNRATMLNKQPGSTAKPIFDYGPGVEYNNWSTYTPFIDEEWAYSNGVGIKNWNGTYYGFLSLKESLGLSRNIPALKAFQNVSNSNIYDFATSLGITPESTDGSVHEAHALGAFNGTNPLQMAAAYAAFANGGYYIEPYTVTKIVYLDTNETKEYKPSKTKVMDDSTAYIITRSLIWAVDSGLSSGERISGYQVAAKTGTTNFDDKTVRNYGLKTNINDYWAIGYTPKISIGLWYGYDEINKQYYNTIMDSLRKDKVFSTIMKGMLEDTPKTFTMPSSVVAVEIEKGTIPAMLPSENTPSDLRITEYFKRGTEPTEISPRYQTLDNPTGLSVTIDKKMATLTWNKVDVPEYFTEEYMNKYYTKGMGDFPANYIKYQTKEFAKLGNFGYDIYIVNGSEGEKYLTTTTDTTAAIDISKYSGDIKFIVRTAWSLEKTSISTGSEYTISTSDLSLVDVNLNGNSSVSINVGSSYTDPTPPVTVLDNFVDVTSSATIEKTITNSSNDVLTTLDTSTPDTYTIKYKVTYKSTRYEKTRTIIVS
jgi:penicillin-binding protein 1A